MQEGYWTVNGFFHICGTGRIVYTLLLIRYIMPFVTKK